MSQHDEAPTSQSSSPGVEQGQVSTAGVGYALGAYLLWGFFPAFWKLLQHVPAIQLLAHRMVWSVGFVAILLAVMRRWSWLGKVRRQPKIALVYLSAAVCIAINWGVYIWSVNNGFVVETALGYFMNPLINVVFGALFLKERARRGQWMAILIASIGVLYLTWSYGQPPWIALTLAMTFALYGLIKKKGTLAALEGLSLETALLSVPALAYLVWVEAQGGGSWLGADTMTRTLLVLTGGATVIPLLFFAGAVKRLTLTTVGIIQYLAPTIQFLLGVFVYQEAFGWSKLVGFVFIWTGLVLYTLEGVLRATRMRRARKLKVL